MLILTKTSKIAEHIAAAAPEDKSIIVDPFCGVGGNTIAFALSGRWRRVYAIEKDPATLACAKHNAEIYGVADQITWFEGDCFEILDVDDEKKENAVWHLRAVLETYGVLFASPPWGGEPFSFLLWAMVTTFRTWIQERQSLQPGNNATLRPLIYLR
jgi:trimethylguanosine synthase